jgi:aminoglycoside phosphotransferase (APT) family kinase protein
VVSNSSVRTSEVRGEDALDLDALLTWANENGLDLVGPLDLLQFQGGASNLTYLVTDAVGKSCVLRKPPHGVKAASAHDMGREARVLSALGPVLAPAPNVIAYCEDDGVLGTPFYLMEYIQGHILNHSIPAELAVNEDAVRALCESMIDSLAQLHQINVSEVGLTDLDRGEGYVARQVSGWSKRYRDSRTEDVPDAESLMTWLEKNRPPDVEHVLIHGDWRFDNLVLDSSGILIGILDWEMSTVGDPCMDLGAALSYWVQADDDPAYFSVRMQPTDAPGMLTRMQVVERYGAAMGGRVQESLTANWDFYEIYGLFRLAVIIQQIWARFQSGATTNPRFTGFGQIVNMLVARALATINARTLSV